MPRLVTYTIFSFVAVIFFGISYLPFVFIFNGRKMSFLRQISVFAFVFSVFLIILVTILLTPFIIHTTNERILILEPFNWLMPNYYGNTYRRFVEEVFPNVLLFVPFGFLLPIFSKKIKNRLCLMKTALLTLLFTVSIETTQYFIGRSSDINDIIANFLGGIIGCVLFLVFNKILKLSPFWKSLLGEKRL